MTPEQKEQNVSRFEKLFVEGNEDRSTLEPESINPCSSDGGAGHGDLFVTQSKQNSEANSVKEPKTLAECPSALFGSNKDEVPEEEELVCSFLIFIMEVFRPNRVFSGNPCEWTKFWTEFERFLVCAKIVAVEEPLDMLKHYLSGEARSAVENFTGDQYEEAAALLKETYGKPEIIEEACVKFVTDMAKLESDDIDVLMHFRTSVTDKLHYFSVHEDRRAVYAEQLANGLLSKLPDALRNKISKRHKFSPLTPEKLMEELEKELKIGAMLFLDSIL